MYSLDIIAFCSPFLFFNAVPGMMRENKKEISDPFPRPSQTVPCCVKLLENVVKKRKQTQAKSSLAILRKRTQNRLLRMQAASPSSFSEEKTAFVILRFSPREFLCVACLGSVPFTPRPRRQGRSSWPPASPTSSRGQPWSLHAWRPSPP